MNKALARRALYVVLPFLPVMAAADPVATLQQLTELHSQVAVLTQELNVARLQAQIAQQRTGTADPSETATPGLTPPGAAPATPLDPPKVSLPTVVSVMGSGIRLTATLRTMTGTEFVVVPGMALSPGVNVYSITENGVSVLQGGVVTPLPFAGAALPATPAFSSPVGGENGLPRLVAPPIPAMPRMPLPGGN